MCKSAARVPLPSAEAEVAALRKGLALLEANLQKVHAVEGGEDKFHEMMTPFAAKARQDFTELEGLLKEANGSCDWKD